MFKSLVREGKKIQNSSLARNASWMAVGSGTGVVLQACYFILLARLLGAEEYGVFVGAFSLTAVVMPFTSLGTGTLLLRYVSSDHRVFPAYWGNVLVVTLTVGGILTLVSQGVGHFLLNPRSASLVIFAGISNCICAQITVETGRAFQAFERLRITSLFNLLTNLLRSMVVGGMLLLLRRATAWDWAVASMLVSVTAAVVAVVSASVLLGRPRFDSRLMMNRAAEGVGFSFAASTSSAYNDVDKTMLSHYGLNQAAGIYTMAYRVVDVATIPVFAIRDAALPRLFKRGTGGLKPAAELSDRLLKRAMPVSLVVALAMYFLAPLIPAVLGPGFSESVLALRWLSLIPVLRCVHQMAGSTLTGAGLQRYRTVAQVIAVLINVGLNVWLIPRWGWLGAAWASLVTDGALGAMNLGLVVALTRLSPEIADPACP